MRSMLSLAAAAVVVTGAVPATAQTRDDDFRLQQAQDRFNRELSVYRGEYNRYGNGNRYRTRVENARSRLDRAITDYRTELDRYQQSLGYNSAYSSNSTYTDDTYYDPARDYRSGNYEERVVANDERIYRGTDGRYYCKRSDGTTGLIVGAGAGALLGNVIDGGRSRVLGTILGGIAGAVGGRAVERGVNDRNGNVTCR